MVYKLIKIFMLGFLVQFDTSGFSITIPAQKYNKDDYHHLFIVPEGVPAQRNYDQLQEFKTVHPRLYADSKRIDEIKSVIQTDEQAKAVWNRVKGAADKILGEEPLPFEKSRWREHRNVGDNISTLTVVYTLSGDRKYFDAAVNWAKAACSYPQWGPAGKEYDLVQAHMMAGLSILYDWCYSELDNETKTLISSTILERGKIVYDAIVANKQTPYGYRSVSLNNHMNTASAGLTFGGLALFDEYPQVTRWFDLSQEVIERNIQLLGPDGASHEGYDYWTYGANYLIRYADLARTFFGNNQFFETKWAENNLYYGIYLRLPAERQKKRNANIDFADSVRWGGFHGPDFILRKYAMEYNNGYAQWAADLMLDKDVMYSTTDAWLGLIWYDHEVKAKEPEDLPTMRHFTDQEIVVSRSDWSGDESIVAFKCGPYMGHKVLAINPGTHDCGAWHAHPDANHVSIFGNGEWLIRDDGYFIKKTEYHNTLLVDQTGQTLEGGIDGLNDGGANGRRAQAAKSYARIVKAESTVDFDYMIGDAALTYDKELGLLKFNRHLVYIKPNVLVVVDDIRTDQPRDLELRFFTEQQNINENVDGTYTTVGNAAKLLIHPVSKGQISTSVDQEIFLLRPAVTRPGPERAFIKMQKNKAEEWLNIIAFSWSDSNHEPVMVSVEVENRIVEIDTGAAILTLDIDHKDVKKCTR